MLIFVHSQSLSCQNRPEHPGGGPLLLSSGCQMTRPPQVGDHLCCPQGARRDHTRWATTFGILRVPDPSPKPFKRLGGQTTVTRYITYYTHVQKGTCNLDRPKGRPHGTAHGPAHGQALGPAQGPPSMGPIWQIFAHMVPIWVPYGPIWAAYGPHTGPYGPI